MRARRGKQWAIRAERSRAGDVGAGRPGRRGRVLIRGSSWPRGRSTCARPCSACCPPRAGASRCRCPPPAAGAPPAAPEPHPCSRPPPSPLARPRLPATIDSQAFNPDARGSSTADAQSRLVIAHSHVLVPHQLRRSSPARLLRPVLQAKTARAKHKQPAAEPQ